MKRLMLWEEGEFLVFQYKLVFNVENANIIEMCQFFSL